MYTTLQPCFICLRELRQAKIKAVYFAEEWSHPAPFPWVADAYQSMTDGIVFKHLKVKSAGDVIALPSVS